MRMPVARRCGLHAQGWSRPRALDDLTANTALSLHEGRTEVDRRIAWPGEALACRTGELQILELRATRELAARLELRAFHAATLGHGGVPVRC